MKKIEIFFFFWVIVILILEKLCLAREESCFLMEPLFQFMESIALGHPHLLPRSDSPPPPPAILYMDIKPMVVNILLQEQY